MKTIQDIKFTSPDDRRIFFNVYPIDFIIQDIYDAIPVIGSVLPEGDDVEFYINPDSINFKQERLIQKVQTGSSRYQLLDWGPDVFRITADSKTGSFLKDNDFLTNSANIPGIIDVPGLYESYKTQQQGSGKKRVSLNEFIADSLISYEDIISESKAFKAIEGFANLFRNFDASKNFMIMGMMERAYRGYLQSLSIRKQADFPWQWTFAFEFVVIESSIDDPFRSVTVSPGYDADPSNFAEVENIA